MNCATAANAWNQRLLEKNKALEKAYELQNTQKDAEIP